MQRLIGADWNAVRVSVRKSISGSRTEGIFSLTESFHTAIIPKGDIIVSTISSIGTTRVDKYTYHEVFSGRERFSIALVLLDGFLVWEIFINDVRVRLQDYVQCSFSVSY